MSDAESRPHVRTQAVWAGEGGVFMGRATQVPVVHSVSFGYDDLDEWRAAALGEIPGHIYGRNTNPTVAVFEEKVRILEGAEAATSFSTGMAAISDTLFTLLEPGRKVVSVVDTYGGTNRMFGEFLPRVGVEAVLCPTADHEAIEAAIDGGPRVLYLESPTNPTCKVLDIARLAARARAKGALVVVDNTFATPVNQHPLELGAHLVIHSATKFLGGHADALGGVVAGDAALVEAIFRRREITGATLHPDAAYMLLRGMKTLALRVERQNANALAVARRLKAHPLVANVFYPGLEGHPNHDVAARQMPGGFGGVLSFQLHGDFEVVKRFLPRLRWAHRAANLGAVETVVAPPATGSHVELTAAQRAALGIPETLVRYSCGIEDAGDLIADLEQALAAVG
ncbi:cystathionine gamma-synthase family protein [Paludisphaera mucosa]|uniref:Cystathionine gamma-synthase family protein n=1 Tax=Paludisphaera mucosa TaxID=3030827 RepID=A0ABT6FB92_9BACT|nr:cystathionine gamma-synthase family protein [Paludisphaera mucosa]MDG3004842.1 cystathionine gamma-synthase family protein [Paludisphaera mucosa]